MVWYMFAQSWSVALLISIANLLLGGFRGDFEDSILWGVRRGSRLLR